MCVIAVSKKGIKQPTEAELKKMWDTNSHGGGYMVSRNGKVEIHKGFMQWDDFIRSVHSEHFTDRDSVVYHFRISTQGGINSEMCHPFPLSNNLEHMKVLDVLCNVGIAHNGIIPITTTAKETEFSDTALFITQYLTLLIRSEKDIKNEYIRSMIGELIGHSKLAIMDKNGEIYTIGKFYNHNGILLSNENHLIDWGKVKTYKSFYNTKGDEENVYRFAW